MEVKECVLFSRQLIKTTALGSLTLKKCSLRFLDISNHVKIFLRYCHTDTDNSKKEEHWSYMFFTSMMVASNWRTPWQMHPEKVLIYSSITKY